MRLHRFFTNSSLEHAKVKISEERLLHQWRNVFRYNTGTELIIFDGSGQEYDAVIERISNREADLNLISKREGIVCRGGPILYQSLIKKDNMEWVVEKATELGVAKIVPIISERSEKKGFNIERATKIAIEASEQCGRADVPIIEDSQKLLDVRFDTESLSIVFDPSGLPFEPSLISKNYNLKSIFIGPEGGWSEKELEFFKQKNAQIYSLGDLTLRAETAAIVALAKFI